MRVRVLVAILCVLTGIALAGLTAPGTAKASQGDCMDYLYEAGYQWTPTQPYWCNLPIWGGWTGTVRCWFGLRNEGVRSATALRACEMAQW
jgi:hypothetical protein